MYQKAEEFGGLISGEHGIGYAKKDYLSKQLGDLSINIMRGIKKVFDEKNILNPEKVCDNCEKCLQTDVNYKIIKITKIIEKEQ
jgi:FAD/FMN-containing dehydrogenase